MTGVLVVAVRGLVWLLVLSHRATGRMADELARACGDETPDDDVYADDWCELVDDEVATPEQVEAATRWCHANTTDEPGGSR